MTKVAVATTSQLAADAASEVALCGGNAVDCAIAAALFTMNTEPGVCALAGSAFVTVWNPGIDPVTIDGNVAVPGRGLGMSERGGGATEVTIDYGGGISTLVGPGSVAVPGTLAAIERAWTLFGNARWRDLFAPTIAATRGGFPLSAACHYYLGYSGECVFARSDDGFFALHGDDRSLNDPGSLVVVPHLADKGDLANAMAKHVREGGGALTLEDLERYEAIERPSLSVKIGDWTIASTPPPAIGGSVLAAMLHACADLPHRRWDREALSQLIEISANADSTWPTMLAQKLPGYWSWREVDSWSTAGHRHRLYTRRP